jgi:Cu(I)/Ag(I) efflux system membrane protein CusA/SilA
MLWLYGQPWFLDIDLFGNNLRDLFQIRQYNLSVAVWVGFLALFGIATDDGVIMATRIEQSMKESKPDSVSSIRKAVVLGGRLRVRAAVMTSATTILALLPVLSSTGRGSDIMIPMAIPTFGGMAVASLTWFVVPILYCWAQEWKLRFSNGISKSPSSNPLDEGVTL